MFEPLAEGYAGVRDVYAFGVVLLEVVSGKHAVDASLQDQYNVKMVDWVWDLFGKGRVLQAVDKWRGGEGRGGREQAKSMLVVGLACSQTNPQPRPKMRHALRERWSPSRPPSPAEKQPSHVSNGQQCNH